MPKTVRVRSFASNHAKTLIWGSALLFTSGIIILYQELMMVSLVASLLFFAAYLAIRVGADKIYQPRYSVIMCFDHMQFHHRYGGWVVKWDNLQRADIPKLQQGLDWKEMHYVGLRLKDNQVLLDTISPRLIAHLLTEQRSALLAALRNECLNCSKASLSDQLLEDDYFTAANGKIYTGLTAMFAHRMNKMRRLTGYDLLIDQGSLDRDAKDFVAMLNRYRNEALREEAQ
ncbi:DUF2982 domain-containing protein [Aliagarivorans taiwanensis]|uniref:DUF2982 domain-containing protein n=1 Tax=Aliagarivorans taiwanensis TaxID=561966 RepID=UPI000405B6E1|nr:DUF2982 domain-containing protein [Aliagarivorans taiwanensis]